MEKIVLVRGLWVSSLFSELFLLSVFLTVFKISSSSPFSGYILILLPINFSFFRSQPSTAHIDVVRKHKCLF